MNYQAYNTELLSLFSSVPDEKKENFLIRFKEQAKNPTVVFGLDTFLGSFGIDRFVLGQPILGVIKLITFGGAGIWTIIDLFLVGGIARDKNIELARSIAASLSARR